MENGIIYPVTKFIIEKLNKVNLVELFKFFAKKAGKGKSKEKAYLRLSVDIFIILKWLFLILIWCFNVANIYITVIVWYLIITNVYTYFYHHIWCDDSFDSSKFDIDRVRRRFVSLLLAFAYSNLCFAYLYFLPYVKGMNWGINNMPASSLHSLWFSMSNSVAANYAVVAPFNGIGNAVAMVQLVITFLFVTIIISRSIPQSN